MIANSAPVALPGRPTPAIVHFEVTLEGLRRAAAALSEKHDIQIVDRRTGEVLIDTRWAFIGKSQPPGCAPCDPCRPRR